MLQTIEKTTNETPFIGRVDILKKIELAILSTDVRKVFCIQGDGGIGKTRLLKEVYRRYLDIPNLAVVEVIDFDDGSFHIPGNIEQRIAQDLGMDHFGEYWRKFKGLRALERAGSDSTDQEEHREEMRLSFIKNLDAFAKKQRLVLLFDTAEKQQPHKPGAIYWM
jgi:hypothetical protein